MIDANALLLEGRGLKSRAAKALERVLERNPQDHEARVKLMAYYGMEAARSPALRKKFRLQNLWFIEHLPESTICGVPIFDLPASSNHAFHKRARALWLKHCRSAKAVVQVLANVARFFMHLDDPKVAEKLLKRAEALQPKSEAWKSRVATP